MDRLYGEAFHSGNLPVVLAFCAQGRLLASAQTVAYLDNDALIKSCQCRHG